MYLNSDGILADATGLGKMVQVVGLLCLLKQRGELTGRAVIVARNPLAAVQWKSDGFDKFAPRLNVITLVGNRTQRVQALCTNWDVCIVGQQMLLTEQNSFRQLQPAVLIADDVDPLRNDNQTNLVFRDLSLRAERRIVCSATPVQTQLEELWNLLDAISATSEVGNRLQFKLRYIREETRTVTDPATGARNKKKMKVGYKNLGELKKFLEPHYLRRIPTDLDDADMPDLVPTDVWLDMHAAQLQAYQDLRRDIVRLVTDQGEKVSRITAMSKVQHAMAITAGLATLGFEDIPGLNACKLDWLMEKLPIGGDFNGAKTVVFCQRKNTIRAVQARLAKAGIGVVTLWGEANTSEKRLAQTKFWDDPGTQVCLGTSAMEQSLNLQCANILVNVDSLWNPRRMEQLAGRLRRIGSPHETVWVYNLLCRGTHEAKQQKTLIQRQAIGDFLFNEASELYEALSPMELLDFLRE
jgi:SNF2 family DNA or RNA helicase